MFFATITPNAKVLNCFFFFLFPPKNSSNRCDSKTTNSNYNCSRTEGQTDKDATEDFVTVLAINKRERSSSSTKEDKKANDNFGHSTLPTATTTTSSTSNDYDRDFKMSELQSRRKSDMMDESEKRKNSQNNNSRHHINSCNRTSRSLTASKKDLTAFETKKDSSTMETNEERERMTTREQPTGGNSINV